MAAMEEYALKQLRLQECVIVMKKITFEIRTDTQSRVLQYTDCLTRRLILPKKNAAIRTEVLKH